MTESPAAPLPGIAALPLTTTRQLGSGQVLADPSSVVKELIDNSLDARAKSIFIDITSNTLDSIQVKDDGHGIPDTDRPLVCRRHCTSKIRDLQDLRGVSGKWLGFRGEALSSMAEMSGSLFVTTRVEGESVAAKLKYLRNGEIEKIERESHPKGTTVKILGFFEHVPVRKQTAIKNSSRILTKIRRLVQAYALARPTVRFRLHVLKARNNKAELFYVPNPEASIEDAALKVIGKECALQCDWITLEEDGLEIQAFLPKPTAIVSKIANQGAFISVDARPVSSTRGTFKRMVAAFSTKIHKTSPSMACVKEPFIQINVICPPDSYDPNIEPAKDDVMFEDEGIVLRAFDRLLDLCYPETAASSEDGTPFTLVQHSQVCLTDELPVSYLTVPRDDEVDSNRFNEGFTSESVELPSWRSSMYGIDVDEESVQFVSSEPSPTMEQEGNLRAAEISNPWTIARMNAAVKPRKCPAMDGLLSPTKTQHGNSPKSSPIPFVTPRKTLPIDPLTPQSLAKVGSLSLLEKELERSIQHVVPLPPVAEQCRTYSSTETRSRQQENDRCSPGIADRSNQFELFDHHQRLGTEISEDGIINFASQTTRPHTPSASRQDQRSYQSAHSGKRLANQEVCKTNTYFGQPTRGKSPRKTSRQTKHSQAHDFAPLTSDSSSSPRRPVPNSTERMIQNRPQSGNNTYIRDFFRSGADAQHDIAVASSFTPINPRSQPSHQPPSEEPQSIGEQLRAYVEKAESQRVSSAGASSMLFDAGAGPASQQSHPSSTSMYPHSPRNERPSIFPMILANSIDRRDAAIVPEATAYTPIPSSNPLLPTPPTPNNSSLSCTEETSAHHQHRRHRPTSTLSRAQSSKLPLERTPRNSRTQNFTRTLHTSILRIAQHTHKLDMHRNTLAWGARADETTAVFAEQASPQRVAAWVASIKASLQERFGGVDGAGAEALLYEGVWRGMGARRVEDGNDGSGEDGKGDLRGSVVGGRDSASFYGEEGEVDGLVVESAEQGGEDGDEFAEGVDDDMLLDV